MISEEWLFKGSILSEFLLIPLADSIWYLRQFWNKCKNHCRSLWEWRKIRKTVWMGQEHNLKQKCTLTQPDVKLHIEEQKMKDWRDHQGYHGHAGWHELPAGCCGKTTMCELKTDVWRGGRGNWFVSPSGGERWMFHCQRITPAFLVFKYLRIAVHEVPSKVVWDEEFILLICMRPTGNVQLNLRWKLWRVLVAVCHYNCAEVKQRFIRQSKGGFLQRSWSGAGFSQGSRMPLHAQLMVSQLPLIPFSQLGVGFTPKENFAEISSEFCSVRKAPHSFM